MSEKPVRFIGCQVFTGLVDASVIDDDAFLPYGLHATPKKLTTALQEAIDAVTTPSRIVIGYGLCGNGLHGIRAGIHTLIVPRADDCIAMFMGSRQKYQAAFRQSPGTYYLTKGWLEVGSDPLSEYEGLLKRYDADTVDWIMTQQYQHYNRLVLVAHSQADLDQYRARAQEVAAYCSRFGMEYGEYLGSAAFVDEIKAQVSGGAPGSPVFIVVAPGETLHEGLFRS